MPYYRGRKGGKVKSRPVEYKGFLFSSTTEYEVFRELERLQEDGLIKDLEKQPKFEMFPKLKNLRTLNKVKGFSPDSNIVYTPDFIYTDTTTGRRVVVEAKGQMSELNKMKYRVFLQLYLPECDFVVVTAIGKTIKRVWHFERLDWHWYIYDTNPPKKKRN